MVSEDGTCAHANGTCAHPQRALSISAMPETSTNDATARAVAGDHRASAASSVAMVTGTTPAISRRASVALTATAGGGCTRRNGQFASRSVGIDVAARRPNVAKNANTSGIASRGEDGCASGMGSRYPPHDDADEASRDRQPEVRREDRRVTRAPGQALHGKHEDAANGRASKRDRRDASGKRDHGAGPHA